MTRGLTRLVMVVVGLGVMACTGLERDQFNELEWELIESLANPAPPSPCPDVDDYPVDVDPTCDDGAVLGQKVFWEDEFSQEGISCASCHTPPQFLDPHPTSMGVELAPRNTPSVVNAVFYELMTWKGSFADLTGVIQCGTNRDKGCGPLEGSFMASDRLWLARVVYAEYREEYEALFGPMDAALFDRANPYVDSYYDGTLTQNERDLTDRVLLNVGYAIESYERRIYAIDSLFDQWVRDPTVDYPEDAKRGLKLFIGKAACIECHSGPMFTDNDFHNTGVAQVGDLDIGRMDITNDPTDLGRFRTPNLRNVELSAPYMHNGSLDTLEDTIWLYNQGGNVTGFAGEKEATIVPLGLSDQDVSDIAAFLVTLTDARIADDGTLVPDVDPGLSRDTSK